jgi:hypothetical protein
MNKRAPTGGSAIVDVTVMNCLEAFATKLLERKVGQQANLNRCLGCVELAHVRTFARLDALLRSQNVPGCTPSPMPVPRNNKDWPIVVSGGKS